MRNENPVVDAALRNGLVEASTKKLGGAFDPSRQLVGPPPYFLPLSLGYAWLLLAEGSPPGKARAEAILGGVLEAQQDDPAGADYGHFRILADSPGIEDLNAVRLVLLELIPLLRLYGPSLSHALRARLTESVRAGLRAIDETEVRIAYSNVAMLDATSTVLGGELLGEHARVRKGLAVLEALVTQTVAHGGVQTFGSPTYLGQMVAVLATLAEHAAEPRARRLALGLQERLWLHVAARLHPGLAQLCGPYARAEPSDVRGEGSYIGQILGTLLGDERLLGTGNGLERLDAYVGFHLATRTYSFPGYLRALALDKPLPYPVWERAGPKRSTTSYLGLHHTLGTASRGSGSQARNMLVHAAPRSGPTPKVLYSRFLADGEARDLNADPDVAEWGLFASVQSEGRAICLYGMPSDYRRLTALRTEIVLTGFQQEDGVWSGGVPLKPGEPVGATRWLYLDLGLTYVAVYPLSPTPLDDEALPVTLRREGNLLRLEIRHYRGSPRYFWSYIELPWVHADEAEIPGPFFRGNLHAGFLIETADASAHGSFEAFRHTVAATCVEDLSSGGSRVVRLSRGKRKLELEVDLRTFTPLARRVDGRDDLGAGLFAPASCSSAPPPSI